MERDIIGVVAEKKANDLILWDSVARANKASLGSPAGSRSMLDALHHTACAYRQQNLTAGLEFAQKHKLDKELKFQDALRANIRAWMRRKP